MLSKSAAAAVEGTYPAADTWPHGPEAGTAQAGDLDVYRAAAELRPLGTVEAADADEAIEKAAKEFKVIASKLIAVQ